jgi:hypothetical protein
LTLCVVHSFYDWCQATIGVKTKAHIGPDGTLAVAVPTPLSETDVEVMLVLSPMPKECGWPLGFFEATAGALKDDPIERGPQGEYEVRGAMA